MRSSKAPTFCMALCELCAFAPLRETLPRGLSSRKGAKAQSSQRFFSEHPNANRCMMKRLATARGTDPASLPVHAIANRSREVIKERNVKMTLDGEEFELPVWVMGELKNVVGMLGS